LHREYRRKQDQPNQQLPFGSHSLFSSKFEGACSLCSHFLATRRPITFASMWSNLKCELRIKQLLKVNWSRDYQFMKALSIKKYQKVSQKQRLLSMRFRNRNANLLKAVAGRTM
jgi:hypothetical protein